MLSFTQTNQTNQQQQQNQSKTNNPPGISVIIHLHKGGQGKVNSEKQKQCIRKLSKSN